MGIMVRKFFVEQLKITMLMVMIMIRIWWCWDWVGLQRESIWLEEQLIFDFHTHSWCRYHITWLTYQLFTFTLRKNKQIIVSAHQIFFILTIMTTSTMMSILTMMTISLDHERPSRPWWPSQQWWPSYLEGGWRMYTRKLEVIWSHITSNFLA